MENSVNAEVNRLSNMLFLSDMPQAAKIYLAHNYLATNIEYLKSRKNNLDASYTQSAYGALINHKCVCQGYAEAFKRLMDANKVECDIICGHILDSMDYHAWNVVTLDNPKASYHVDVTWDTSSSRPKYTYFCIGDSAFLGKREWDKSHTAACNSRYSVSDEARKYITCNKSRLLAKGVSQTVLDC